jgi:hypothetical protein
MPAVLHIRTIATPPMRHGFNIRSVSARATNAREIAGLARE